MRTNIPEKLLNIADEIDEHGSASLTRLTVLKKWFEKPERLSAFAVWVATRAISRKGKTGGTAAELSHQAKAVLAGTDKCRPKLNRQAAESLHHRLRSFQDEYRQQRWGPVRIIRNWNLMLVEHGLAIHLWHTDWAADYCENYDSRYGNGLNGPSRARIEEIGRFVFTVEALEEGAE
jgi:hypothetical protein